VNIDSMKKQMDKTKMMKNTDMSNIASEDEKYGYAKRNEAVTCFRRKALNEQFGAFRVIC
jgi:hypothetical protein